MDKRLGEVGAVKAELTKWVFLLLRSMNGVLEFVDTQDMTVMAQTEHFMATDVEWDPTGRFVTSAVSWWGHKVSSVAGIFL